MIHRYRNIKGGETTRKETAGAETAAPETEGAERSKTGRQFSFCAQKDNIARQEAKRRDTVAEATSHAWQSAATRRAAS